MKNTRENIENKDYFNLDELSNNIGNSENLYPADIQGLFERLGLE